MGHHVASLSYTTAFRLDHEKLSENWGMVILLIMLNIILLSSSHFMFTDFTYLIVIFRTMHAIDLMHNYQWSHSIHDDNQYIAS